MSTVLRSFLKPLCDSGRTPSVIWARSLERSILVSTLPEVARREMPLLFPHTALSPFFLKMLTMSASFHFCGQQLEAQTFWKMSCRESRMAFPPCFRISAGMPSGPAALLFF